MGVRVNRSGTSGRVIDEVHADTVVSNTTTETDLCSLTLPAGTLAAGDRLLFLASGEMTNNSAGSISYTFKFKIGATTVLTGANSYAQSVNHRTWFTEFPITAASTAAQRVGGLMMVSAVGAATMVPSATTVTSPAYGTAAEDTTSAKAIALTITMASADTNASCTLHSASITLVKK